MQCAELCVSSGCGCCCYGFFKCVVDVSDVCAILFVLCVCCLLCVVSVVVQVLRDQGSQSAAVAEQGFRAIANMCGSSEANETRLGDAGACKGEVVCISVGW